MYFWLFWIYVMTWTWQKEWKETLELMWALIEHSIWWVVCVICNWMKLLKIYNENCRYETSFLQDQFLFGKRWLFGPAYTIISGH